MWFLVAIMTLLHNGDEKDVYVWSNPHFTSSEQCLAYVKDKPFEIWKYLKEEFPNDNVDRLLCVEEERLKEFLNEAVEPKGESI